MAMMETSQQRAKAFMKHDFFLHFRTIREATEKLTEFRTRESFLINMITRLTMLESQISIFYILNWSGETNKAFEMPPAKNNF